MFTVTKRIEVAGCHFLKLPYESPCQNAHGHNWIITVTLEAESLNADGMVMDFKKIKEVVNQLDHADINFVVAPLNPTAENIALWIFKELSEADIYVKVKKVTVQESEGNVACYIP